MPKQARTRDLLLTTRRALADACQELEQQEVRRTYGTVSMDELVDRQVRELVGPAPDGMGYAPRREQVVALWEQVQSAVVRVKAIDPDELQSSPIRSPSSGDVPARSGDRHE